MADDLKQAEVVLAEAVKEGDVATEESVKADIEVLTEPEYPIVNGRPDSPYHQRLAAMHMSHS